MTNSHRELIKFNVKIITEVRQEPFVVYFYAFYTSHVKRERNEREQSAATTFDFEK